MFKIVTHQVDEAFFTGAAAAAKEREKKSVADRYASIKPAPPAAETRKWQQQAEELSKRYATLLQAYKQIKARSESVPQWRNYSQKMLNELLRTVQACEFADAVEIEPGTAVETLANVLSGIRQLRGQALGFLCDLDLLKVISPEIGQPFDRRNSKAVTGDENLPLADARTEGAIVDEVIEPGLAYNEQVVKTAVVKVSLPVGTSKI